MTPAGVAPSTRRAVVGVASGAGALALTHVLPGAVAWRRARCALLPSLSGVGRRGHVALTFDDGPDPASTPAILDRLDELGWRATFFCLGGQARRSPGLVRKIVERGHELGVHGSTHKSHLRRPMPAVLADVRSCQILLEDLSGTPIHWLRPPYGAVAASTLLAARSTGLRLVLWTTWGKDWKEGATPESVAAEVDRTLVGGATVLLHDSDVTSTPGSWKATVESLRLLGAEWRSRGFDVGPLREHF